MKKIFLIVLTLIFVLTGCNKNSSELSAEVLQAAMETILNEGREEEETPDYLKALDQKCSMKVKSFKELEEGSVEALVSVESPDFYSILKEFEGKSYSSAEVMEKDLAGAIENAKTEVTEITVYYYQEEESWIPILTEDLMDIYYGGLLTYRYEYLETLEVE